MVLSSLRLQNFRNHKKAHFSFSQTTVIIGKNTVGKTNILEAIYFLSSGKSFRAERDWDVIQEEYDVARIEATVQEGQSTRLTIVLSNINARQSKNFLVNDVPKRHVDFVSHFVSVLFTPQDIEIITDSPSLRRRYIDSILNKASREYRHALVLYEKGIKQRNRMLYDLKVGRKRYHDANFDYWNAMLIENGQVITKKREEFVAFINNGKKNIFDFELQYDHSKISAERLLKYHDEERAAGVTLVGPQRDDFLFLFSKSNKSIKEFGSRGEQRLTLLQMKLFEIEYLRNITGKEPTLLLDDIFSELDDENIHKVFALIPGQQTIITTTHKEFIPARMLKHEKLKLIEL